MPSRLKLLELSGYKTFANRTRFEFSDRITAIVGPNGSGKSNIADSLRWVLGEQSYSLLRGKRTEDMIFSGSELRPRSGMAFATITFDNTENWLPIDFSEVAITRRAYRDGTNEYLINGQRVRLKDVSELLAQSGLAERTYTIIGQGLVDAVLSLRAEERRRLFEEAAGIGLHRSRREEALRRLEVTQRNLDRVQDILAELEPRLRSLERQARRAQEYDQVKNDLRDMLRDWYGYYWHQSQIELTQALEIARAQEMALEASRLEHEQLDHRLNTTRSRIQALRLQTGDLHRQLSELHSHRETVSRNLAVSEERIHTYEEQDRELNAELLRVHEELELFQGHVRLIEEDVSRLEIELDGAREQTLQAQWQFDEIKKEREQIEITLDGSRQILSDYGTQQSQYLTRLAERQNQIERNRKALTEALASKTDSEEESLKQKQALESAKLQHEKAKELLDKTEKSLQSSREALQGLEHARILRIDEQKSISSELAGLEAQVNIFEQADRALVGYSEGSRILLQTDHQGTLAGVLGALITHIHVPADYEVAISAALGEYLDSVILESDPDNALDLLEAQSARGVLLPVQSFENQSLNSEGNISDLKIRGLIGNAASLVESSGSIQPIVELLLRPVWVVENRRSARHFITVIKQISLQQKTPVDNICAVTLKGEVFFTKGPILSGYAKKEEQTLLSRRRQKRELNDTIEAVKSRLSVCLAQISESEDKIARARADVTSLEQERMAAYRQFEQNDLIVNQALGTVGQTERLTIWHQQQVDLRLNEIERDEKQIVDIQNALKELEEKIQRANEEYRNKYALIGNVSLDEPNQLLSHWKMMVVLAERGLADTRARLQEREQISSTAQRHEKNLQSRLSDVRVAYDGLVESRTNHLIEEKELSIRIENLRSQIDPLEKEIAELEKEQINLESAEAASRQALGGIEHRHAQARISVAHKQEALETLRVRIEDDFGLVAFEYEEQVSGPTPLPLEGMVEQLPYLDQLPPELEESIRRQRGQLRRMGPINPEAQTEYREVKERYGFLTEQLADLEKAEGDVREVIAELDELMESEFRKTFEAVSEEFKSIFHRLFGGGVARLILLDAESITEAGIDIEARLPGRRMQGLSLLSGGERSLTATALIFALLKVSPTPFCVLDEVDAMLDEANVSRFRDLLWELSQETQFVVVTHNRNTVQVADTIYGVTMGRDSASQVVSLRLDEVSKIVEE